MKKFTTFILFLTGFLMGNAQPWNSKITNPTPTFYDFKTAFNSYWEGTVPGKGEGYTQFKRWEWFWEQRVDANGNFPPADINYKEWEKFQNSRRLYKASPVKTHWTFLGPTSTPSGYNGLGRLNCVAFHPTDANTMWVGSPSGGIWKTTDFGKTWSPLSDFNAVLGVSSIAVNPTYPDSMYIATGDGDRGSLWGMTGGPQGDNKSIGILLTTDGGITWKSTGMNWNISDAKLISKVIMNPNNSKHLLCAASDGVYVTTDAGATWLKKQSGYFMDIAFCPGKPSVVYAATYEFNGNAKMFRSANGGNTFTQTFSKPLAARITIGTTKSNPSKVHLLLADKKNGKFGGIHESLDSGKTFIAKYDTGKINLLSSAYNGKTDRGQGWYDLAYVISPNNENDLFVGGVNTWKSSDGGKTFKINTMWSANRFQNPDSIQTIHADKHYFAYNPLNNYLFDCNDGGIYYSTNNGTTWKDISDGLGITQFYRMAITESDTDIVLGGTQDNGARVRRGDKWYEASGGDGMECAIDPTDANTMYSSYAYGRLYRLDNNGTSTISDNIKDKPKGAWVTPYVIDPNNSSTLYAGFKAIYKTTDKGATWAPICDSLWRPNHVINIAVASTNSQIIYASDYYKIYKTSNGGQQWSLVITATSPITCIKVHPRNPDIFYYTLSAYTAASKVYRINSVATGIDKFTNLSLNLPNVAVNCIEYDKQSKEGLYIGTDIGTFYKDTSMSAWEPVNANMPNVVVTDLEINYKERILYAATYGRGMWKTRIVTDPKLQLPVITSIEPPDNSTKVQPSSQLIIYFSKPVKKGTGNITVFEGGAEKETINVNSDTVVIEGHKVIINPSPFGLGKPVYIRYPEGTFLDLDNNKHKGIVTTTDWNFTITSSTAIGSISSNSGITISPNPTTSIIHIKSPSNTTITHISVYNNLGVLVSEKSNTSIDCCELNLSHFAKGLYNVVLNVDGKRVSERVILE